MKFRYALLTLAFACTGDLGDKSGDTGITTGGNCPDGPYNGPIEIEGAEVTCTGSNVHFEARTKGLTGDGWVFSQETGSEYAGGQWADNHTIESYEFDTCGTFDKLERDIQDGTTLSDPVNDWQQDVSSVFTCANHYSDNGFMTFAFSVDDQSGNQADCLAFGDDVEGMKNNDYNIVGDDPVFNLQACRAGQEGL